MSASDQQDVCIFELLPELKQEYGACSGDRFPLESLKQQSPDYNFKGFSFKSKEIDSLADLIRCRGHFFSEANPFVCDEHVRKAGTQWRTRKKHCVIPEAFSGHSDDLVSLGRAITKTQSEALFLEKNLFVAVGSKLCLPCIEKLNDLKNEHRLHMKQYDLRQLKKSKAIVDNSQKLSETLSEIGQSFQSPPEFSPGPSPNEQVQLQTDAKDGAKEALRIFCSVTGVPIPKVSESWAALKPATQQRRILDIRKCVENVVLVYAPNDAETVLRRVADTLSSSSYAQSSDEVLDAYLSGIAKAYSLAEADDNPALRTALLSIAAVSVQHSVLLQYIPGLTAYRFTAARTLAAQYGQGKLLEREEIHRTRFSRASVQHFINFLVSPLVAVDLPFGTTTLRYDEKGKPDEEIPKMVRKLQVEQIIDQYYSYCEDLDFEPLSRSTLKKTLAACPASYRKCLAGIDNYAYYAGQAFKRLGEIVDQVFNVTGDKQWSDETKRALQFGKRYISCDYKVHLQAADSIPDHCITHLLSDQSDSKFAAACDHNHGDRCDRCEALKSTIAMISEIVQSEFCDDDEELAQLLYDINTATEKINSWKYHQVRTVQQDRARIEMIKKLRPRESVYLHCDFAMRWLAMYWHEAMVNFFSKRGMPWHITSCIRRVDDENFEAINFIHCMEQSSEDSNAVTAIIEDCLKHLKADEPDLKEAFIRSDNAGAYHSASTLLTLPTISENTGVMIKQMDFIEAQSGKDICDQIAALVKGGVRTYVAQGNDVISMDAFVKAAEAQRVPHTKFLYGEVKVDEKPDWQNAFPGVTKYNNFEFTKDSVTYWRGHGIGRGSTMKLKDWNPRGLANASSFELNRPKYSQPGSLFRVVSRIGMLPWEKMGAKKPAATKRSKENAEGSADDADGEAGIFQCSNEDCTAVFLHKGNLDKHEAVGKHRPQLQHETLLDTARSMYAAAQEFSILNNVAAVARAHASGAAAKSTEPMIEGGACLKERKQGTQYNDDQRTFLAQLYDRGVEKASHKMTPDAAAVQMRSARSADGTRRFAPNQCLEEGQIKSWWQRYPKTRMYKERHASLASAPSVPAALGRTELKIEARLREMNINEDIDLNDIETADPWKLHLEEIAVDMEQEHIDLTNAALRIGDDASGGEEEGGFASTSKASAAPPRKRQPEPKLTESIKSGAQLWKDSVSPLKKKQKKSTSKQTCKPAEKIVEQQKKDDPDNEPPKVTQKKLGTFKSPMLSVAKAVPENQGSTSQSGKSKQVGTISSKTKPLVRSLSSSLFSHEGRQKVLDDIKIRFPNISSDGMSDEESSDEFQDETKQNVCKFEDCNEIFMKMPKQGAAHHWLWQNSYLDEINETKSKSRLNCGAAPDLNSSGLSFEAKRQKASEMSTTNGQQDIHMHSRPLASAPSVQSLDTLSTRLLALRLPNIPAGSVDSLDTLDARLMALKLPDVPAGKNGWQTFVETICFTDASFYSENLRDSYRLTVDDAIHKIEFYPWICWFLILKGIMFQTTHLPWLLFGSPGIIWSAQRPFTLANEGKRAASISRGVAKFVDSVQFTSWLGLRRHGSCVIYILSKFLQMFNVVVQLHFIKWVIRADSIFWPIDMLNQLTEDTNQINSLTDKLFPRRTFCKFQKRELGNIQDHTFDCAMPQNLYFAKVYMVVWFALIFAGMLSVLSLAWWLINTLPKHQEKMLFKPYVKLLGAPNKMHKYVRLMLGFDGCFLLQMLVNQLSESDRIELMEELFHVTTVRIQTVEEARFHSKGLSAEHIV